MSDALSVATMLSAMVDMEEANRILSRLAHRDWHPNAEDFKQNIMLKIWRKPPILVEASLATYLATRNVNTN